MRVDIDFDRTRPNEREVHWDLWLTAENPGRSPVNIKEITSWIVRDQEGEAVWSQGEKTLTIRLEKYCLTNEKIDGIPVRIVDEDFREERFVLLGSIAYHTIGMTSCRTFFAIEGCPAPYGLDWFFTSLDGMPEDT